MPLRVWPLASNFLTALGIAPTVLSTAQFRDAFAQSLQRFFEYPLSILFMTNQEVHTKELNRGYLDLCVFVLAPLKNLQ